MSCMYDYYTAITVGWERPAYTVLEQRDSVEVCATLTGTLTTVIPVLNINFTDGSAIAGIGRSPYM